MHRQYTQTRAAIVSQRLLLYDPKMMLYCSIDRDYTKQGLQTLCDPLMEVGLDLFTTLGIILFVCVYMMQRH